ncbi:AfsR/SARP family transcriptional regulator [Streptomyces albireticuli]|uniref:AfsR/SARP family transcriptional regulator n=1 Tax=Streptomyces albireticuli TaxID=1940 RepID=A0A2A2D6L9_9ACTN|nr:BTAD domain-containing putative transcriptional regulator [Streptomyces albireticuli]PAU48128.1 AfsR/SARP family transcriptional regulator [Streptomyces albireticuli]
MTRILLLGPVQYVPVRGTAARPGAPGPQAVLAALALRAGNLVTIDELIDGLYHDDPPSTARRVVVNYVHRLRTHIDRVDPAEGTSGERPSAVIGTTDDGYVLRLPDESVDALRFGLLTARARHHARSGDPAAAAAALEEALGMWRGTALAGLPGPAAEDHRRALTEQRASAVEHHLELLLECGRSAELVPDILRALEAYPYRERLHGALMLALYRSGRAAEALLAFEDARRVLADELGVDAGPALRELHAAVLAEDQALLAVPGGRALLVAPSPADEDSPPSAAPVRPGVQELPAPAQLPPAPYDFTGRQEQLSALVGALDGGAEHAVAVITGMGGVGKTTLALRTAHTVAAGYPDGQLYANLRGPDGAPGDPAAILAGFLAALGVPHERFPASLADRTALFRTLLSRRAVLVVLDNAAGVTQVEPLLPGAARCAALITARALAAMPATLTVPLVGMGTDDAVELIGKVAGARRLDEEPEAVAALAAACGHLPLALRAAGARLAARPAWSVATLLERVSDQARLLGELRVGELTVEAVFELSTSQLPPRQARAFMALSIPHYAEFDVRGAAAVLDLPERDAETVLEALVDAVLLETRAPGRYHFHDLVGAYARAKAKAELSESERRAVVRRAADYICASVVAAVRASQPLAGPLTADIHPRRSAGADVGTGRDAMLWVRGVLPTVVAVVEQAAASGDPDAVALAVDTVTLVPCFEDIVPLGSFAQAATALVPAAVALCGGDIAGTAYYAAGVVLQKHSSPESLHRSRAHLLRVLDIFGDAPAPGGGPRPFLLVLFSLAMLAQLELQFGNFAAARAYAERSVAVAEVSGDRELVARRRTLLLQVEVEDPERRIDLVRIGAECRELSGVFTRREDEKWLIRMLMTEAESVLRGGGHAEAAGLYRRVLERARHSGHARNETECLFRLSEALLATGDTGAAVDTARDAVAGARLAQEPLLTAHGHRALGLALRAVGEEAEAASHLERAEELYRALRRPPGTAEV